MGTGLHTRRRDSDRADTVRDTLHVNGDCPDRNRTDEADRAWG